ncbi:MAG TPA: ABC transporter permease [Actinobacteria bacterium]|nr:ABC transporter permease [Actinomycetota bacterium]
MSSAHSPRRRWFGSLPEGAELIPFILILGVVFALLNPAFLKTANLLAILASMTFVGVIAIGQTVVIISGGIDLSVGAVAALCAVTSAKMMVSDIPLPICIAVAFAVGVGVGMINGTLTVIGIPSFIVTVGTLYMAGGLAVFITKGQPVFPLPPFVTDLGLAKVGLLTAPFVLMLVLLVVTGFVLRFTRAGRRVYAVGGDAAVAALAGISTRRVLVGAFAFCGFTAGLAGVLQMGALASASNTIGAGWELTSIAAVVIGGTSIFGGRGTVLGTLLGLLLLGIMTNGLVSAGVEPNWQTLAVGAIMIAAIGFDFLRRRVRRVRAPESAPDSAPNALTPQAFV